MAEKNSKRLEAKSADYEAMQDYWSDVTDFMAGERAVKLAGKRYLPEFPGEPATEYDFRLKVAKFTNIFRDIIEGLASKPFERAVTFVDDDTTSELYKQFVDDVDGSGRNITLFAMEWFFNAIAYSNDWIFVDFPKVTTPEGRVRTKADDIAEGVRPLWSRVKASNVYEVQTDIVRGEERITYIRVFEPANGATPNRFREMQQVGDTVSYVLWEYDGDSADYFVIDEGVIAIGIVPMFNLMLGRRDGRSQVSFPPLLDAKNLQATLYRAESNLEVTKAFTAYPMLVGQGVAPDMGADKKPKRIIRGPGIVLYAPFTGQGANTDWKYIEPAGSSLTFLTSDIKDIKQDMRELGKQPLTVTSGNLTTITTAVAASKAKSAVKSWAQALSDALTMAMYFTALWYNDASDAPRLYVYDEFDEFTEPGTDIQALLSMYSAGALSLETLWAEMQRRKVLSTDFDAVEESRSLLDGLPTDDISSMPPTDDNPPA